MNFQSGDTVVLSLEDKKVVAKVEYVVGGGNVLMCKDSLGNQYFAHVDVVDKI